MPITFTTQVNEDSSCRVTFQLTDLDGTGVANTDITTAVMSLKDKNSSDTINSHATTSVTSSFDGSGNFSYVFDGDDNPIIDTSLNSEIHIATITIDATVSGTQLDLVESFWIEVKNLRFA